MQNNAVAVESRRAVPQKTEDGIALLDTDAKALRAGSRGDPRTPMFTAALFTIARRWKQPECPSTRERISKMWHVHTMDYDLAVKREEIRTQAATWMDLEDLMLSEISKRKIPYDVFYI